MILDCLRWTVATKAHSNSFNRTFSSGNLVVAVAVSAAESQWNPNALGDNGTSYGLWQIHVPPNPYDPNLLLSNLDYSAMAAREIYDDAISFYGSDFGWTPWTTWWPCSGTPCVRISHQAGNGNYRTYLSSARSTATSVDTTVITGANFGSERVTATANVRVRGTPGYGGTWFTGGVRIVWHSRRRSAGEYLSRLSLK